jgi:transcriptional antiterminator NusG
MEDQFGEILIPTETVQEARTAGKSRIRQKTSLPGYVFIEMEMSERTWHLVKETNRVTGFIGNQNPTPVKQPEIEGLRQGMVEGAMKPKPRVTFEEGDEVRVIDGAFANFSGTVEEVKPEKQKLRVKVSIFGRATPVELDFSQVEKR